MFNTHLKLLQYRNANRNFQRSKMSKIIKVFTIKNVKCYYRMVIIF